MRTVILDGMNEDHPFCDAIQKSMDMVQSSYFALRNMNVLPCRSCGVCGHKTPGECFIQDDMPDVLRAIANSDTIVMLTPVTFGGYSAQLKKAVDKFMVLGEAMYMVKDGHLLHPMRYGHKNLIVAGVEQQQLDGQRECFETLVAHNALNMQCSAKTIFVAQEESKEHVVNAVREAISEVIS